MGEPMFVRQQLTFPQASRYLEDLSLTNAAYVSRDWLAEPWLRDPLGDKPPLDCDPFTSRVVRTELGAEALVCRWRIRRPGLLHLVARRWWYVVVHVSNPFGHCRSWVTTSRREAEIRFDTLATRVTPHLADIPLVAAQWSPKPSPRNPYAPGED